MANSTNDLDQLSSSMSQKEVVVNENFDACSPAFAYGRRASTSAALTWGYNEATIDVDGTPTKIAAGTIALTANATNYLYRDGTGVVYKVTSPPSGWPGPIMDGQSPERAAVALYEVVTGASSVTSWTDYRCDLTGAAPAAPSVFVGDSGSGGVAGLVPAPAAGDGAAGKVLQADGTWDFVAVPIGTLTTGSQGYLGSRYFQLGQPQGNQWLEIGPFSATNSGSGTGGGTVTTTDYFNQSRRLVFSSTSAVNSQAGQIYATLKVWRGNAARLGGFLFTSRFGAGSWHSDGRWAMGVSSSTSLPGTTTEPSTIANSFLIGQDSTDTNIQVMSHDNGAGSTKADLGGSFPRPTASVDFYEVTLACQPNASTMQYSITNLATGVSVSSSVSATLPSSSTLLYCFRYSNNGPTTTGSVEFAAGLMYIETGH